MEAVENGIAEGEEKTGKKEEGEGKRVKKKARKNLHD